MLLWKLNRFLINSSRELIRQKKNRFAGKKLPSGKPPLCRFPMATFFGRSDLFLSYHGCFPVMRFSLRTFTYVCSMRVNERVYVFWVRIRRSKKRSKITLSSWLELIKNVAHATVFFLPSELLCGVKWKTIQLKQ